MSAIPKLFVGPATEKVKNLSILEDFYHIYLVMEMNRFVAIDIVLQICV